MGVRERTSELRVGIDGTRKQAAEGGIYVYVGSAFDGRPYRSVSGI